MHNRILFLVLAVFLAAPTVWSAKDLVGAVSFMTGTVQVTRNNKTDKLSIGSPLENFDRITVAKGSSAEIKIDKKTGIDATIKLQSGTILSLDISALKTQQKGGIELITGSVETKVQKMTNGNALDIRTGAATMGVRGTTFQVTAAPGGEILLSTDEGRVECKTNSGKLLYSEPGSVVQSTGDEQFSNLPVALKSLNDFRKKWFSEKLEAFKANPTRALKQYAARYVSLHDKFYNSYKELLTHRDTVTKWIREEQAGTTASTVEQLKEKKALIGPLFRLRANLVLLEKVYYRLLDIEELVQGSDLSQTIADGRSLEKFLSDFDNESDDLSYRLNDVANVVKLYAKRNGGSFPLEGPADLGADTEKSGNGEPSFFSDADSFFNK